MRSKTGLLLLLMAGSARGADLGPGSHDPAFTRFPFSEWEAQGQKAGIPWRVETAPAVLSPQQRLLTRVSISVDGHELEKRRGRSDFVFLLQYRDGDGYLWQTHTSINLKNLPSGAPRVNPALDRYSFMRPGNYTLSVAVCDTDTLEHSFMSTRIHIAGLRNDPLRDAWLGLPSVEFIRDGTTAPDIWFLPEIRDRINLRVPTRRPVHIHLLVNVTPPARYRDSTGAERRNMSLLIPALRVLSEMKPDHGSVDAALIDLASQRIPWQQKDIQDPDWSGLKQFLMADQPGEIDVHALRNRRGMERYFFDEVSRRMQAPEMGPHLVIVLSGVALLDDQEKVDAVPIKDRADSRLVYIRYRRVSMERPPSRDDLAKTLAPLNPRVYDAASAVQFRRILAEVLRQIAAM